MNVTTTIAMFDRAPLWVIALSCGLVGILTVWTLWAMLRPVARRIHQAITSSNTASGAHLFYAAAVGGMAVSVDTSWNFFGDILHVDNLWARGVMFFVLELAQLACGRGMQISIRRTGTPGAARWVAWALCVMSAYMAWILSGFWVGIARVVLGPILSLVMLHLALGIEVRRLTIRQDSMLVRIGRELRERFLAVLGLADEHRDAKAIAQERALNKAIEIRMKDISADARTRRFVRQLARAGIVDSPETLNQFVRKMQLAANAQNVYSQKYDMPAGFETSVETETMVETESETVSDQRDETKAKTNALTSRSQKAEAEIGTLLQLMNERGGATTVSLNDAMDLIGLSKATADRRLRAARERFTQAS